MSTVQKTQTDDSTVSISAPSHDHLDEQPQVSSSAPQSQTEQSPELASLVSGFQMAFDEKGDEKLDEKLDESSAEAVLKMTQGEFLVSGAKRMTALQTRLQQTRQALRKSNKIALHWRELEWIWKEQGALYRAATHHEAWDLVGQAETFKFGQLLPYLEDIGLDDQSSPFTELKANLIEEHLSKLATGQVLDEAAMSQSRDGQVALQLARMQGMLAWNTAKDNAFRVWLDDDSASAPQNMSCWEAPLYAAHVKNLITKPALKALYEPYKHGVGTSELGIALGVPKARPLLDVLDEGGLHPGDIIVLDDNVEAHVAISLGGQDVMSLWTHQNSTLTRIKITDMVARDNLSSLSVSRGQSIFST